MNLRLEAHYWQTERAGGRVGEGDEKEENTRRGRNGSRSKRKKKRG